MSNQNERLKVLLHDAQTICLNKCRILETKVGRADPDLLTVREEMDAAFSQFDDPAVWVRPLSFDEHEVNGFILAIESSDDTDLSDVSLKIRNFLSFLQEDILQPAGSEEASPSDFNRSVLDTLLLNQRHIQGRKLFFKQQNIDVDTHPGFTSMEQQQQEVIGAYRQALKQNKVASTESDVSIFKNIGASIQAATDFNRFLVTCMLFTSTMKNKLAATTDPPQA